MKEAGFVTARLDLARFAAEAAQLSGVWPGASMPRLTQDTASLPGPAAWSARGEQRTAAGAEPQTWLHLAAGVDVVLTCQRCLQPFAHRLEIDRALRFVADAAEAERLDELSDEDVLALPPQGLDLHELLEDELILALPLVPMHDACTVPLPRSAADEVPASPFQVLQALKRSGSA